MPRSSRRSDIMTIAWENSPKTAKGLAGGDLERRRLMLSLEPIEAAFAEWRDCTS